MFQLEEEMSGLQMCLGKQELSKRLAMDMAHTGTAVAVAAVVDSGASGEDRGSLLHESNAAKSLLMPEIRTNASVAWNLSVDPQHTWHTPCSVGQGLASALQQHLQTICAGPL